MFMFKYSELLITVKYTIFVILFALSVDKRKRNLFATRYSVVDSEEFLRIEKKKFRSRVCAALRLYRYANCESHLKSEFIVRCDWCCNSPWEKCPGMNETSWLCKRAGCLGGASRSMPRCSTSSAALPCHSDDTDLADFWAMRSGDSSHTWCAWWTVISYYDEYYVM